MPSFTRPVLFVGSIPLKSPGDVFEAVAKTVGAAAKRIPDGETGVRSDWIVWQKALFKRTPGLEIGGTFTVPGVAHPFELQQVASGHDAKDIKFEALGYAREAVASYAIFKTLRDAGKIAPGTRFQVSLPSAFGVIDAFFMPHAIRSIWPVYEQKLFDEIDEMLRVIPARDLAIQWDLAVEICNVLARPELPAHKDYSMDELGRAVARACDKVPADAEVGVHFCYGDPGHKHIIEPVDTAIMVDFMHAIQKHCHRPINWCHMPVPRERSDDAYFEPLKRLKLDPGTELYLGLLHRTGGIEGTKKRIATARKYAPQFGISTECGLGRRPPETIPEVLALHHEASQLPA